MVKTEIMKRVFVLICVILVTLVSCKTTKKTANSAYEPATSETGTSTKIFTVPQTTATDAATTTVSTPSEPAYNTRQEAITFVEPRDQNQNSYFIIIGSFSSLDNARNFRQSLIVEGFTPVIVQSETGFYRVTIDSFSSESQARSRLLQVRRDYPKYSDTWLLIKK